MSAINGLRGTGDWGVDERPKDFRNTILWMNPNGSAPIFAMTGRASEKTVSDPEYSWWAETNTIVRLQTSGALIAGDTTITVNSVDPTATSFGVAYGTATHLKPGDLLLVEPPAGAFGTPEYLLVTEVLGDTGFTVQRGAAGSTPASIASGSFLLLIGSAYAEGTAAPRAVSRNPVKFSNYTQIFKTTYELTKTANVTEARTGDPWSNDKKRKMYDHSRDIEHTLLYAYRKTETTGDNGKPLRYTGGLRAFVPATNVTAFTVPATTDTILSALEPLWKFTASGELGGDTRVCFTGMSGALAMAKIIKAEDSVQMQMGDTIKMWGLDFQELKMPWGRLLFKTHPLLSHHPTFKNSFYILDFAALKWCYMKGRNTVNNDDVQMKDEDVRRGFWLTEGGWFVDGGGMTMGILDNVTAG
jgi:hypothetical protein